MNPSIIINYLIDKGELVDENIVEEIKNILSLEPSEAKKKLILFFKSEFADIDSQKFIEELFPGVEDEEDITQGRISIVKSYEKTPSKRTIQDFVRHLNIRFKKIESMLKNRTELQGLTSISKIKGRKEKVKVSLIGMVIDKAETKNKHIILTVEDLSGSIKVLIHKDNKELIDIAKDISLDETLGIVGQPGGDIVFSDAIIFPDVPLSKELKKSPLDHYSVFLGDFHIGSNVFLKKEFKKFLLWINGKVGSLQQRKIAKKVRYVFFVGDLIEGTGIYPGQENDLEIDNVRGQYEAFYNYIKHIPSHIKIIICPGNHDVGRIAEPQLPIPQSYAKKIYELPNVIMVSNPALVSIDVTPDFSGIDVLLYHGYSLIYYSDAVTSLRQAGGQKVSDRIMQYLLQRRHLAPTHGSTLYIPDITEDALLIDPVPDIFATGHIHRAQYRNYRNVTCMSCSCWTQITEDQEKRGLEPMPARAMLVS
ncbi:MAG: metallophosphoesterase [Minisyncoccales bacterium]